MLNDTPSPRVFVTVGSTAFNELIETIFKSEVLNSLCSAGYKSLRVQFGSGEKVFNARSMASKDIQISGFSYSSSLDEEIEGADLVISHAGSGSILEALRLGKKLIVVANQSLMDNHQMEVANKLSEGHYLVKATPSTLADSISRVAVEEFKSFPQPHGEEFRTLIERELGIL